MNKKKPEAEKPPFPMNMCAQTPKPPPTLVEQLQARKANLVRQANDIDRDIEALDKEITWLQRNPGAESIVRRLTSK